MKSAAAIALVLLVAPWLVSRWSAALVYMDNWPDGSPKVRAVSHRSIHGEYVFNGQYRSFYEDGATESEGLFHNGDEEGAWRWLHPDGSLAAQCEFEAGSGDYQSFHSDGSIAWSGRMVAGSREGPWHAVDAQGRPLREGSYRHGLQDGEWKYWSYGDSVEHYTGLWDEGVLLEDDGELTLSPALPLTVIEHLGHVAATLFWLLAPWPLAWILAARFAKDCSERWLAALVLILAAQIFAAQMLLALGLFGRWSLLVLSVVVAVVGIRSWIREAPPISLPSAKGSLFPISLTLVAVFASTRLWTALVEPPNNFDSLAYHLPVMADWVQQGALHPRVELGQVAYYAFGWECLGAATMALLSEDALIAWPNLVALTVLMLSVFVLARRIGAGTQAATLSALSFLAMQEFVVRVVAIQPDLPLAAFFMSGLVFAGFPSRSTQPTPWLLTASWGLLLAVKMTGLVYLFASIVLLLLWRRPRALRKEWFAPSVFGLLLGGFWYVHNLTLTGNPLGLMEVRALGLSGEISASVAHQGSLARLFSAASVDHWRILGGALQSALGWALWVLVALLPVALFRREGHARSISWMIAAFVLCVLVYWNTPYGADNGSNNYVLSGWMQNNLRFAFSAFGIVAVLAARGLDRLGSWGIRAVMLALSAGVVWSVVDTIAPRYEILVVSVLVALLLVATRSHRRLAPVVVAAATMLLAISSYSGRYVRHDARLQLYGSAYESVLRRVPAGSVVGTAMTQKRYPWVGPRLDRRVRSAVPLGQDAASWYEQLERDGIDALLVGYGSAAEWGRLKGEDVRPWLQSDERFELLSGFESQKRDVELWRRR